MKIIIGEKPSVAREIAAIVGAKTRKEGYWEGNGYAVTYAFGHLVGLAMPEAYGFSGFRRENLPILPKEFILVPRQVKEGKEYKNDPGAMKQLNIIKELFGKADGIIEATDSGREGELIFRYIYDYAGCTLPFERLWISSLTDKAIREGLQNLKPGSDYDNLYLSAKARSQADYVVGVNASQALSIAAGSGVYSLGRVQTPTLAMICSRYLENKAFQAQTFFQLKLHTEKDAAAFAALSTAKFDNRPLADAALSRVCSAGQVEVTGVERKEVNQEAPLLYDLTTLQKEANSRHGFSADKTLSIAQTLYEKKLATYPRTGSRYIPTDVMDEIPELIGKLKNYPRFAAYAESLENTVLNIRSVDNKKITDHHALLITENRPGELSEDERTLYEMIAGRMLESFSGKCKKENTVISLTSADIAFSARGSVMLAPGWRGVFNSQDEEKEEDATLLPAVAQGDRLTVSDCGVLEKQTKPRPIHTEASLLSAMEQAGRELENEDEREAMKDAGIGTPATRAGIIETLLLREYMRREKKSLVPTEKGLVVYQAVKDKKIADAAMTGSWEHALSKIETGKMSAATFHREIEIYAAQITAELLETKIEGQGSGKWLTVPCPKCKTGHVAFFPKVAKCDNAGCGLLVFRGVAGRELTDSHLENLFAKGSTGIIKGFNSKKTGKPFDAALIFDSEFKTGFQFSPKPGGKRKFK
ncbi:DNA topoisomerase I [Bacteroidia bacterium]|nr:DNA topoisomerase I [Bacteroidia bacterium]